MAGTPAPTSPHVLADALRILSADAVEQAASGHPGMPMGMADIAEVLWRKYLRHNPKNPTWPNRDRFVVSNGHGSMLLYSLLHLTGYPLTLKDLRAFRQLHSRTPGHPELDRKIGVETTTGPLGQGLANAVGMALAEWLLGRRFNREDHHVVDHYTYAFAGDGCLMEGISHEACSLAGTLRLGKLIVFYDDNGISIDGETQHWFTDSTPERFAAYGWHVVADLDGHNRDQVDLAIREAQEDLRPSLLCCRTLIGYGAPNKCGTADAHGAPLGEEEVARLRKELQWEHPPFDIPKSIRRAWNAKKQGEQYETQWRESMDAYAADYPDLAEELNRRFANDLPDTFSRAIDAHIRQQIEDPPRVATRKHSGNVLDAINRSLPELIGGSADLTGSNNTQPRGVVPVGPDTVGGHYLHYGVREFGMSAIMNGMALHGGFIPYGGTFLTFSDYARNAIRMAALMGQRVIFVMTHDSIGLGEDGPTHQAVEHLASLRLIPNLDVWRPADGVETSIAWKCAIQANQTPSILALSRQTVEPLEHTAETAALIARGGYVLMDTDKNPQLILIATGSEVQLAVASAQVLAKNYAVRVVSIPCVERFAQQDPAYIEQVLPEKVKARIAVEAGVGLGWKPWVGEKGLVLSVETFGCSAPGAKVMEHFGFTVKHLTSMARKLLGPGARKKK